MKLPIIDKLRNKIQNYSQQFLGRAIKTVSGTVVGQIIAFLCLPLISRIYKADVIGQASTVLALVNIFSMINCLQYDQAIVVADDRDLGGLTKLAILINIFINLILFLFLLLFSSILGDNVSQAIKNLGFNNLFPLINISYTMYLLLSNWQLRQNNLTKVSIGKLIYLGGGSVAQVIIGALIGPTESGFLMAMFLACLVAGVVLLPDRKVGRKTDNTLNENNLIQIAKKYKNFPRYQLGSSVVNAFGAQLPVLFLRVAFSETIAGLFFMAWRILAVPINLLHQAIGQVFFRDAADLERSGSSTAELNSKVIDYLIKISFLPSVLLAIMSPYLVNLFLGKDWSQVGPIIQYLLIGITITFIVSPISTIFSVVNKQSTALVLNIILMLLKGLGLLIGWLNGNFMSSILLFSIGTLMGMLIFLFYIKKLIGFSLKSIISQNKVLLLGGVAILLFMFVLGIFIDINTLPFQIMALFLIAILGIAEMQIIRNPVSNDHLS